MQTKTLVGMATLGLLLCGLVPIRLAGQEVPASGQDVRGRLSLPSQPLGVRKDWEYKQLWPCQAVLEGEDTAAAILSELNDLGKKGWELVTFAPVSLQQRRDCFVATFKRPLLH
jgi:hypothetical protein